MKKLIILFLGLAVISCGGSEDDESMGRTTDPIIGTWLEIDETNPSTLVFGSSGNYTESDSDNTYNADWVNNGNNFDSLSQTYTLTAQSQSLTMNVLFSEDFNTFSFTSDNTTYSYRRQ